MTITRIFTPFSVAGSPGMARHVITDPEQQPSTLKFVISVKTQWPVHAALEKPNPKAQNDNENAGRKREFE